MGGSPTAPGASVAAPGARPAPPPMPLLRLSREQYRNTVKDLLGVEVPHEGLLPDDELGGSGFAVGGSVSVVDARNLLAAAEHVGQAIAPRMDMIAPCAAGMAEPACAAAFIGSFGRRAYRRPLAAPERQALEADYARLREQGSDHRTALRLLVQAMLQSPYFLYRWELTDERPVRVGAAVRLTSHQIASRLSYFLWNSTPDAALSDAADRGELANAAGVEAQARRLIADPRVEPMVRDFALHWLEISDLADVTKSAGVFPAYTPALMADMQEESARFAAAALLSPGNGLEALLRGTETHATAALAKVYGATAAGEKPTKLALDPGQRAGVLTLGAFLSKHATPTETHPVKRGAIVFTRVLCGELPPTPPDVPAVEPPKPGLTTRERFAAHSELVCAKVCHGLIDPYGFALESYDGIGRFRTTEQGKRIDTSGVARLPSGGEIPFQGAVDLMPRLASSEDARGCLARQWLRLGVGRADVAADEPSVNDAAAVLARPGGSVRDLLVTLTTTSSFLQRSPSPGEVLP
jgi:hypothetical protein